MKSRPEFKSIVNRHIIPLERGEDNYGLCLDFNPYCEAMFNHMYLFFKKSTPNITDEDTWISKSISCAAYSGKFSSDRTVTEYADLIWHVRE